MSELKHETPRGYNDRINDEPERLRAIADAFISEARLYGARELDVSPVGYRDTFMAGTNLDEEKTYAFKDRSGRDLMLNCDSLPAVMRAYIGSKRAGSVRYAFSAPVHRYRRTKLRYYHHLGATFINEPITDEQELVIPRMMVEVLRGVTSKKVDIVMNEFRLWLGLFKYFGFSEEDARNYFFYRRFFHSKDKELQDAEIQGVVTRIEANQDLLKILSALHEIERGNFNEVSVDVLNILPRGLAEALKPYYQILAGLKDGPSISNVSFDVNEFHSSEFFHGLGYRLVVEGEDCHIGDGGSYHSYGRAFSERISTVYSGVFRHEDLLMHDDKIEAQSGIIGVYMLHKGPEAKALLNEIRRAGHPVFEDETSRKASQAASHFKDIGIIKFAIIGDEELASRELKVRDIDTGEYTAIKISQS